MNQDIAQGKWKQLRGKTQEWWGKLTNDDLDMINGNKDQLVGKLQERYGYSKKERATQEVNKRWMEYEKATETKHPV